MRFSYKPFTPEYKEGKLDKESAMKMCVGGFKIFNTSNTRSNLERLGKSLQAHVVYSNIIWMDNYRKKANALLNDVDMLIIDIDVGLRIDDVLTNTPFQIMTLTTASHTQEHHKFRVFILLEKPITFRDNIEYREFLRLIDLKYFSSQADKACFEAGRGFITTDSAQYQINDTDEMLDCSDLLKEAKIASLSERLKKQFIFNDVSTSHYSIEDVKRFPKVKALASSFSPNNHYRPVFQILGIAKKTGLSDHDCVQLILSYRIGGEYSDYDDLMKKVKRYS